MSHPVSAKGSYLHLNEVLSIRAQELAVPQIGGVIVATSMKS